MRTLPDIRLIAADLDGTLLDASHNISLYNIEMIKKAQQKGIIFAIATGRFPENAALIAKGAGLSCPIISLNGAVVELSPNGERILETFMEEEAAKAAFDCLESLGEGYHMFGRSTVISRRESTRHISESNPEGLAELKKTVSYAYGLDACKAALDAPVFKYFVYFSKDGHTPGEIYDALVALDAVDVTASGSRNLEVMSNEANKGLGLKVLADALGIDLKNTMALGDQMNDLAMLKKAGLGVAMGNATEEVKASADAVTEDHNDSGVGRAIARYCFPEEADS